MSLVVCVDGFIEIAKRRGLLQITAAVGPGATGLECLVSLTEANRKTLYRYTMKDVEDAGSGHSHAWEQYPYEMFKSFGYRMAVMDHYRLNDCGEEIQ